MHASLFGLFDRNPPITGLSRQLGNSAGGALEHRDSLVTNAGCMMEAGESLSTRVSSHTNYILWVQRFNRSLLFFVVVVLYLHSKSLSSRLIHSAVKPHQFVFCGGTLEKEPWPGLADLIKHHSYLVNVIILTVFH